MSWDPSRAGDDVPVRPLGYVLALVRAVLLIALIACGLILLLLTRLIERPFHGLHRPWTPYITQTVCRGAFFVLGMKHRIKGTQMREPGAVVANHGSWLDIFTLNARKRVYFVSKAEVAGWPGIGWLARATGTVFITRDPRHAKAQKQIFEERLLAGHKLLFFPEGTSTDTLRVLPFKPTLFEAFFADELRERLYVQPVTVIYHAPRGASPRFYGWWGDMDLAPHLLKTLSAWRQGRVEVIYHTPLKVSDYTGRKPLAKAAEEAVRSGMPVAMLEAGHAYDMGALP